MKDHPWANRECVPMADLAGEKLLMLEDGHCLRDQAMGFCFEAGADEDTHFRATSSETLRNMVAAGSGITFTASAGCAAGAQTRWGCLSAVH